MVLRFEFEIDVIENKQILYFNKMSFKSYTYICASLNNITP